MKNVFGNKFFMIGFALFGFVLSLQAPLGDYKNVDGYQQKIEAYYHEQCRNVLFPMDRDKFLEKFAEDWRELQDFVIQAESLAEI
jgi:hypothetical protein